MNNQTCHTCDGCWKYPEDHDCPCHHIDNQPDDKFAAMAEKIERMVLYGHPDLVKNTAQTCIKDLLIAVDKEAYARGLKDGTK